MENTMFARRNVSIDMLRGLTMLLMVFVNDLWSVGGVPHFLEHFEAFEDGMGVADIVFPMFLFAMGMSIPYGALSGVLGLLKCVVFPLSQQMEFNSRLLKLNDDADKGVDRAGEEFLKSWGNRGKCLKKSRGNREKYEIIG